MEVVKAYRYLIYPDSKRQSEIDERLVLAQQFYNRILDKSITSYRNGKVKVSMVQFNKFVKDIIQEDRRYLKLYSQTRCEIEYRLLRAFQNFFKRVQRRKNGEKVKVGFPRFRSRGRYNSLTYPQDNGAFSIEKNRLRVSRIGTMKIELHRPIEGKIKTLTIKRDAGQYYAIFSAISEIKLPEVKDTNPIGIDMGLKTFAVLSDGNKISKPNFAKKHEKKLYHWQRKIARGKKGSHRRDKAKLQFEREWQHINNESNDFIQKTTTELVKEKNTHHLQSKGCMSRTC